MTYRHYFLLLLASCIPAAATARTIGAGEARSLASGFFKNSGIEAVITEPARQSHASNSTHLPYYIFNTDGNRGFVIIAGDDRLGAVLGYSDSGAFTTEGAPESLKALLGLYERYTANSTECVTTSATSAGTPVVEPLLNDINWGQDTPFNYMCPTYSDGGNTVNYYTGCVVTAATQIMKFHNYPETGTGSKSYNFGGTQLSADFANTTYDWASMPGAVPESVSPQQQTAYSTLASHFGIAVEMKYAKEGSGTYTMLVPYALKSHFGYDHSLRIHTREYYTSKEWMEMITAELDAHRPVYYGGTSDSGPGGHAFVCDGYDSNGYVHINWGWYGRSNGYFLINHLNPSSLGEGGGTGGYNRAQEIITGIRPATTGTEKAYSLYGATRLSCVGYESRLTMMSYIENLDTDAVSGLAGALLMKDDKIVKVLGTSELAINGFKGGYSGTAQIYMSAVSADAGTVADGDYILKLGVLPQGCDEWIVMRHPVGLPAYVNATVANGKVIVGDQHKPSPEVKLLDRITPDGDMFANCHASLHFNIQNNSDDYRLKNITVRFTSVADPSRTYDMSADVNIYDLSTEEFDILMQLPDTIVPGEYSLTAYETSCPEAPFDDSEAGRTVVEVSGEPSGPVLRLTSAPAWVNNQNGTDAFHGQYLTIGLSARNYGAEGTVSLLTRLTDVNNPDCSYIFLQQDVKAAKGQAMNIMLSRKMIADPGKYHVEISTINADGNENPVDGYGEQMTLEVNQSDEADIEVTSLDLPANLQKGVAGSYTLGIRAAKAFTGTIYVRLRQYTNRNGQIVTMKSGVRLDAGQESSIQFKYSPTLAEGKYMTIVESRPSSLAMGNEIPALGLGNFYREVNITDPASTGHVDVDTAAAWSVTCNGSMLEASGPGTVKTIAIHDLNGRVLDRSVNSSVMDISALQHGTYIVKIETDKASTALKIKK